MSVIKKMASMVDRLPIRGARWVFNCNSWKPNESDWLRAASGIQEDEKSRIGQFVFQRDAKYSMAGRLMMRKFIVDSTGLNWKSVSIIRDENNKPVFADKNFNVQFNVSHQGNYAVLAGDLGTANIGIDVMKIEYSGGKSTSEFFRIMKRQFSHDEWSVIKSPPTEYEQLKCFYRFWCLKESYVKATGTGITVNLQEISFKLNSPLDITSAKFVDDTELFLCGIKQDGWTFEEIMIDNEHCCAVALNLSRDDRVKVVDKDKNFSFLNFNELIKNLEPVTSPDVMYCREFLAKEDQPF